MNKKKVAFIMCTNNELYKDECIKYIECLKVPEGYEVDVLCVEGATSMAAAYNEAMHNSDAKYKVYLHQDVFIYNRTFIEDMVSLFETHCEVGLLGVIGGVKLPKNANCLYAWNRGGTYAYADKGVFMLRYEQTAENGYVEVEAIDGMIMMTQYDVEWREDLALGWDFYDISQSLEFRKLRYKVGLPVQEIPWCLHDCGRSNLKRYDCMREKILAEYTEFFDGNFEPLYEEWIEKYVLEEAFADVLKGYIENRQFAVALKINDEMLEGQYCCNDLINALHMLCIFEYEKKNESIAKNVSFFDGDYTWETLRYKFDVIKFMVREFENESIEPKQSDLWKTIVSGNVSLEAVAYIVTCVAIDADGVLERLKMLLTYGFIN